LLNEKRCEHPAKVVPSRGEVGLRRLWVCLTTRAARNAELLLGAASPTGKSALRWWVLGECRRIAVTSGLRRG
ncbi:MAG: hypothetical protein ACO1SX_10785, partial [Actinomycetota bacterium]